MRKKKTPEELAAEAEQEDLDDFTSKQFNNISKESSGWYAINQIPSMKQVVQTFLSGIHFFFLHDALKNMKKNLQAF